MCLQDNGSLAIFGIVISIAFYKIAKLYFKNKKD